MRVFGADHAPQGHMHGAVRKCLRAPRDNILLGEGRGLRDFADAPRAGPHSPLHAHHRQAEVALDLMVKRGNSRTARPAAVAAQQEQSSRGRAAISRRCA